MLRAVKYFEGSAAKIAIAGTFVMDPTDKRFKLKLANGTLENLSGAAQVTNSLLSAPSTIQENATAQVSSGSTSITPAQVQGILVLSDPNKAIILPKVPSPHLNIKNPVTWNDCIRFR